MIILVLERLSEDMPIEQPYCQLEYNKLQKLHKLVAGKTAQGNMDDMGRIIASDLYFSFFTDNESPYL